MLEHDPYSDDASGLFSSIAKAVGGAAKSVGKAAGKAVKVAATPITAPAHLIAKVTKNIPVLNTITGAADSLGSMPFKVTQQILEGGNISKVALGNFKQALSNVKALGPYVQTVISFVPGIGTGVSAAIGAGLALAEGQSITDAMMAGVKGALPGGPAAQMAFNVAKAAIERKPLDQIAIASLPISDQQKKLLAQGMSAVKDIASGKNVAKSIVDNAVKSLPPDYAKAVQIGMAMGHAKSLQDALKTGAAGAASIGGAALAKSGAKNMNLFTKAASNLGVTKAGIEKAVGAAQAIKNGSPVLKSSLAKAVSSYVANSPGHVGFKTAVAVLKNTSGNKVAMGVARRALPNEAARQGFDAAVGVVAKTVSQNPGGLAKRAGSSFVANLSKPKANLSPYQPNLKHAIESMTRNPTLVMQHPMVLANKFGTSQQTVLQALKHVGTQRLMPWRSLSPNAANFIRKWNPNANVGMLTHGTNDTAGLDESGTKYIVEKGDSPFKIAQKLTGNGNRWTELKALNADKKPAITVNVWVGEVLNLPASWQKPTVKQQSPGPAASSQPAPQAPTASTTVAAPISIAPGILQGKGILVAWGKTDGVKEAGVSNYGATAEDLSTNFGPRDSLQLKSYQNWNNKTGAAKLVVDGKLGPKSLASLQAWAEKRAAQAIPASPVQVSVPGGTVTTLPEIVIEGSASSPSPVVVATPSPVVVTSPGIPQIPQLPVAVSVPAAPTPSPTPIVASPSQPVTVATPAAQPKPAGSSMGPALAGAAIGGTLFGLPGAIIGGVAGAAMA
jgi:hypothetical protein